jgi:CRP-like cAMP-binding protein
MQTVAISKLKEADIFRSLNEAQLTKLASIAARDEYPAGTVLFKKGDAAARFYIVYRGRVLLQTEVDMGPDRPPLLLDMATVAAGHSVGWSVFVKPYRYTTACLCTEDTIILSFNADQFRGLLDRDPELGYEVLKGIIMILASRLNNARELLLDEQLLARLRARGETLL